MGNKQKNLLDEYFGADTTEERKKEIRTIISQQKSSSADEIVMALGDAIHAEADIRALRTRMKKFRDEPRQRSLYLKIAASIAILAFLTVFYVLYLLDDPVSDKELFEAYYAPYPAQIVRGHQNRTMDEFYLLYARKNYHQALVEFSTLVRLDTVGNKLKIYWGNCLMNTGETEKALEVFNGIHPDDDFGTDAVWFASLCLIQLDQPELAVTYLDRITEGHNIYSGAARELLQKLSD